MTSRAPFESLLKQHSDLELQLFIASQRYNVRAKRQAIRELKVRRSGFTQARLVADSPTPSDAPRARAKSPQRPKGSISDIAWLGVILGTGALTLQLVSWAL